MTCQYLGAVCLLCSLVMTSSVRSRNVDAAKSLPPVIINGPDFHEYFRPTNDRITLPCAATGTDPVMYKWVRNGELVKVDERIRFINGSLVMQNPTADMQGYYQCFASNIAGVAMSNVAFVRAAVLESNQNPRTVASSVTKSSGDPLILPCSHVRKSIPAAFFRWETLADGKFREVQLDNRIEQTSDGALVFSFVSLNDTALYICSAYNRILRTFQLGSRVNVTVVANDLSAEERISNIQTPVLLFSSPDTTSIEGEDLHLTCIFGSWPHGCEVEWTVPSGSTAITDGFTVIKGSSFTIQNVSSRDEGLYTCRALIIMTPPLHGSRVYSHTTNISVQVDAIPSFEILPNDQEIVLGQNITFTCQGHGRPSPVVTWYINGTSIDEIKETDNRFEFHEGQTSHLTLTEVHSTATVTCNISNAHGYRLHTAVITSADQNDIHITSPSSQSHLRPTTELSLRTSVDQLSSNPKKVDSLDNGISIKPIEFQPATTNATKTSLITETSFAIIVGVPVFVVVACVIIIFYLRRRKQKRQELVVSRDNRPQPDDLIVNRIAYDSEDSGYDDLRTENPERLNLRQV